MAQHSRHGEQKVPAWGRNEPGVLVRHRREARVAGAGMGRGTQPGGGEFREVKEARYLRVALGPRVESAFSKVRCGDSAGSEAEECLDLT